MSADFEYAIKKDVRNNPIVREVDRERQREMWRSVGAGAFLVVVLLFSAWQHFELLRHGYRIEQMQPLGPIGLEDWDVDWKIAMDNYLESYHVPVGHPGLNRLAVPDYEDQRGVPGVARGIGWLRDTPSSQIGRAHV